MAESAAKKRRGPYRERKNYVDDADNDERMHMNVNEDINLPRSNVDTTDQPVCSVEDFASTPEVNVQTWIPSANRMATSSSEYFACRSLTDSDQETVSCCGILTTSQIEVDYLRNEELELQANTETIHLSEEFDIFEDTELAYDFQDDYLEVFELEDENIEGRQFSDESIKTDQQPQDDPDLQPLFEGANITVGAFMLILSLFNTNNGIVGVGIQNLLNIFALILPNENKLCRTLYEYKAFFKKLKNPLVQHFYCYHCLGSVNDKHTRKCPNTFCGKKFEEDPPYFLELPLQNQIKNLFGQENFYNNLQGRFRRKNYPEKRYEDIYDGYLYQSYFKRDGPLSSPENISFVLNTDGAPVFKSSNVSIWPIYLSINELPYRLRTKTENMILAGLWFGSDKPAMSTYLKPLVKSFQALEQGVEVSSPVRGSFKSRAFLLCATADLPAKCLLCNSVQYNGSYSCWKCIQKGITAKVGKGHTHVFPFMKDDPKGPTRTITSARKDATQAILNKQMKKKEFSENGVKGFSWLNFFPKFDIINGIAIDYMHGVLLGVQKLLIRLWFSKAHSGKQYNFHGRVCEVDRRLTSIKPTLNITRLPRSIANDLKYWKASEYRSFLLYYGGPVLNGILDSARFNHYLLFVNAINIFLTSGSTEEDISRGEVMMLKFCSLFDKLYDACYMTLNLHQLVHLADSVRCLGPLYTNSCFPFEDKNGYILKLIRGTQNIDSQIVTGVSFIQKLPELKQNCIPKGSDLEELYNSIENPHTVKRNRMIQQGIYMLGAKYEKQLNEDEFAAVTTYFGHALLTDTFSCFNRIEVCEDFVYGTNYKRMEKRNNSAIRYFCSDENIEKFGIVRFFIEIMENNTNSNVFAVIEELALVVHHSSQKSHIFAVKESTNVKIIPVTRVSSLCMYVKLPESSFICIFPNKLEGD